MPGLSISSSVNFKKSLIEKNEDIYGIIPSIVNDYLYDVSNTGYTITDPAFGPGGPGVYFYQSLTLDPESEKISRSLYTFISALKEAGGLYSSIFMVGFALYSRFQGLVIFSELINKLY